MQARRFIGLFLVLFICAKAVAAGCCGSTTNNAPVCSVDNDCNDGEKIVEGCFFKSCVSCPQKCGIENRCCGDNGDFYGKTFFSIRPQDSNVARRILSAGTNGYDFRNSAEDSCFNDCNARAVATLEYQQSFHDKKKLGTWFSFNCDDCSCMTIGVPSSKQTFDINSVELGITTTNAFSTGANTGSNALGEVCLNPKIRNIIADLDFKFDLSDCACNTWARINMVIANCKTHLDITSDTTGNIGTTIPAGYVSSSEAEVPYNNVLEAFEAQSPFGEVPRLKYGRFSNNDKSKTGVAGIHLDLGYDFARCERGHVGASLHLVFPTGTRPKGVYIFEPVIGANKSWQLGATVNASYDIYKACDNNSRLTLFFDSVITHLFKARQYRPFQLKNGPGSEYLILKQYDSVGKVVGLERAANILHGETKIGANVMFDGALMLQYAHCNFFGDLGYNLWYRSKEKRSNTVCFSGFEQDKYGIKGAQANLTDPASQFCTPIPGGCTTVPATASKTTISTTADDDAATTFIGIGDIDFSAPLNPHAYSNKIFASLGYQFDCKYPMYVLLGGEVEFGQDNRALNQWGVLGQFGISF